MDDTNSMLYVPLDEVEEQWDSRYHLDRKEYTGMMQPLLLFQFRDPKGLYDSRYEGHVVFERDPMKIYFKGNFVLGNRRAYATYNPVT